MRKSIIFTIVCLILTGLLFGCGSKKTSIVEESAEKSGLLSAFEKVMQWDIYPERGFKRSLSKEHVTEGKHSLKVVYPAADYPSINTREIARDWEGYDYFCFDVFNPQDETLDFTIRIDDSTGERENINFPLKSGKNKVNIPILQIAKSINIEEIDFIVLFLNYPQKRYTLYFDNMRLEKEGVNNEENIIQQKQKKKSSDSATIAVWAIDESVKVKQDSPIQEYNHIWNESTKTVSLYGAKNEYTAFQVIIKAGKEDISVSDIKVSDLTGPVVIDESNIQIFKEHYLRVTEPSSAMYGAASLGKGKYPDPLIPLEAPKGGVPISIRGGRNQPFWVDIYIPPETKSGLYKGELTILAKGLEPEIVDIFLEVWDFSLPDQTHLKTFFYYGPEQLMWAHKLNSTDSPQYQQLEESYQRMAHQHRMNMSTDVYHYKDWAGFLKRAGGYLDGTAFKEGAGKGVGVSLWVIGEQFDLKDETKFQEACKWYMEHFRQEGWADKPFLYIVDEPDSKKAYDKVRKIGRWIDEAVYPGNNLAFMLTEQVQPQRPQFGSLVGYVDIWCSGQGFPEQMAARKKAGDRVWTYNGGPDEASVVIDTYGLACRSWAWTAWKRDIECWFLWDCTYWVDKHNLRGQDMAQTKLWNNPLTFDQRKRKSSIRSPDWGNGDGTFFYPGHEKGIKGPISSFRMKAFRRGMQDYEYLYLAKELGKEKEIKPIVDSIITGAKEWNKDAKVWYEARIKIAKVILSALDEKRKQKEHLVK